MTAYAKGSATSQAAAQSMEEAAPQLRLRVLEEIRGRGGMTCDEVEVALELSHQTASARIRELVLSGDVVDSGSVRATRSERKAVVWVETPPSIGVVAPVVAPTSEQEIVVGDCIELLKKLQSECVDAVVTDPPYGMSDEPDAAEVLRHWLGGESYEHGGSGFMNKKWDSFVPGPEYWRECFRVLKPGGHLLCFSSTRTDDLVSIAIRLAGFVRRDEIRCEGAGALAWEYGSGFPKSLDVGREIDMHVCQLAGRHYDKNLPAPDKRLDGDHLCLPAQEGEAWRGHRTALKPSWEPVLVFRKPLVGTMAENVLKFGTGGLNIDGCRIEHASADDLAEEKKKNPGRHGETVTSDVYGANRPQQRVNDEGRWPANLVIVHLDDCEQTGTKLIASNGHHPASRGAGGISTSGHAGQEGLAERKSEPEVMIEWRCVPGCPVVELDRQSGTVGAAAPVTGDEPSAAVEPGTVTGARKRVPGVFHKDKGGASRFFYTAKASRSEREAGLEHFEKKSAGELTDREDGTAGLNSPRAGAGRRGGRANVHPTVKPIALMRWLCRLVTPPGGIVLDPFAGSGTTGCACALEGFNFIGMEREPEYAEIARARIAHWRTK